MNDQRWVVLGLARPRTEWFRDVARWSTTAAIPVDFVKCVSADEVQVRVDGGRRYSALLVGADVSGLDRDLIDAARRRGLAVVVVVSMAGRGGTADEWTELGADAVLPAGFDSPTFLSTLRSHATPVARLAPRPLPTPEAANADLPEGRMIAVTGAGGTGASVAAMAIAQAFGREASRDKGVLLADLRLHAEQGMLHDARELVPGIQELTEAHRTGRLASAQVRSLAFDAVGRGYHLLLGLPRHRDWTSIRPRAFVAALEGLVAAYDIVVADVGADVEDEEATGSPDIGDRNLIARHTFTRADLVVAVGNPTTKGLHALARITRELHHHGVAADRIVPVCSRTPRSIRRRSEATRALDALLAGDPGLVEIGNPVFVPERNDVETAIRDGTRLPPQLGRGLHAELSRRLASPAPRPLVVDPGTVGPSAVVPGSLGSWAEEAS